MHTSKQKRSQQTAASTITWSSMAVPEPQDVNHFFGLQRALGNQAMQRLLQAQATGRAAGAAYIVNRVIRRTPASQVQRQPKVPQKSADDQLAHYIDGHPAWGTWTGGSGSIEAYQEIEANLTHNQGEGSFYRSPEFTTWYFHGWHGLSKLEQPAKALQFVATMLITDAQARNTFFADIQIGASGGQIGATANKLDKARQGGKPYDAGDLIEDMGVAIALDRAQASGNYDQIDYDLMAKGRTIHRSASLETFERFTLDGIEVSPDAVSQIVQQEITAKRQIPQIAKDFTWIGTDPRAGELETVGAFGKKEKHPKRARGGISSRTYKLADGRTVRREFWHRVDPNGDTDRGNRMLRLVWSSWMGHEGLPASDPSALIAYGAWTAGRMAPGGGFRTGATKPPKPSKPAQADAEKKPDPAKPHADAPNKPALTKTTGTPMATLPNGKALPPDSYSGGYHGTDLPPQVVMKSGLPARGNDWSLQNHAEELWHYKQGASNTSAFRGTTQMPSDPVNQGGAAYMAGEGGYVYQIKGVPTWDVNKALQGRVGSVGNYRGNAMHGETEYAIPAQVPPAKIVRWGVVKANRAGRLYVEWAKDTP